MIEGRWVNKLRILTMALIFSGALNVGLLAALIFSTLEETQIAIPFSKKPSAAVPQVANQQLLLKMVKLSFPELVTYLTNKDPVEEGYAKRDLALSALVKVHCFNLEKALSFSPLQRRFLLLSPEQTVELYPGLTEEQYEAIIRFAYQEKWPLTAKGLYHLLKNWPKNTRDASLAEAFFVTAEFHAVEVLFQKTGGAQEKNTLLDLLCEGPWDLVEQFALEQGQILDFSIDKRRSLLLSYLNHRSQAAAALLLKTDYPFAKSRLEDPGMLALFECLKDKTEESVRFCTDLLRSPRSDEVLYASAKKLYGYASEEMPLPFDPKAALSRFGGELSSPVVLAKKTVPTKEHIVKDGDTLWKISRQYKVKVEEITALNGIENGRLFPGMTLLIP